jgi:hypothetical protein
MEFMPNAQEYVELTAKAEAAQAERRLALAREINAISADDLADPKTFHSLLSYAVTHCGVAPGRLAKRLRVDPVTVSRWINKRAAPATFSRKTVIDAVEAELREPLPSKSSEATDVETDVTDRAR